MKFFDYSRDNYKDVVIDIYNSRKKEIFDFFEKEIVDFPINVYIYDSIDELVNGLSIRGFSDLPSYMCAFQNNDDNSVNYFEPVDNPNDNEWSKEDYKLVIFHEFIHAIQFNLFGDGPEWLFEGIAKYLDGTYKSGIKYLMDNYILNNPIPKQSEIENEFGEHEYDSYDYAYIMVSYLIDYLGKGKFLEVLESAQIDDYKDGLLEKAINFYK